MSELNRQPTWAAIAVLAVATPAFAAQAPLGEAEVTALVQRVIRNQQRDDLAFAEFERRERTTTSREGQADKVTLYRMVPTGLETGKVLLERDGQPVEARQYHDDLRKVTRKLEDVVAASTETTRGKADGATYRGSGLLVELEKAFTFQWMRREFAGGRPQVVLALEPKPGYVPAGRIGRALPHVRATVWIDEKDEQFVRIEAEIFEDISVAGFLGRIDQGSHISLTQVPVGGGVWLVEKTELDISGRKLLFGFDQRRRVECDGHRRVGSPREVLAMVRHELARRDPERGILAAVAHLESAASDSVPAATAVTAATAALVAGSR